jgi:flagellar basal body L-ring protein FlgH
MKLVVFLILSTLFTGCANYINSVYRQIDREEAQAKNGPPPRDGIDTFRQTYGKKDKTKDKRPINNPVTFSLAGTGPSSEMRPAVKREYRPQRYNRNDFVDDDSSGSLWGKQSSSSSLFISTHEKGQGDVVIINVLDNLRNQISSELKRAFPDPKKKTADKTAPGAPGAPAGTAAQPTDTSSDDVDMKVYDKVSGTVVEEINENYLVVRGRKEVIFKKEKRSIEIEALVSRRDILENDHVNSDKILESRVFILR